MRDRLEIRCAVAVFYEKALIIFQQVGCAGHRHLKPIGIVILDQLPRALLAISCCDNTAVRFHREARSLLSSSRRLGYEKENGIPSVVDKIGKNDLGSISLSVFRKNHTNCFVAPAVATRRVEHAGDSFHKGMNTMAFGKELA